jgi:hypothetical protein
MILGIDNGTATCGWALLDETTCEFVDMGVVIQPKRDDSRTVTLERERRANLQAQILASKAPGASTIVLEQMSFASGPPCKLCKRRGHANAMISVGMSWGIVLGIVAMLDPRPRLLTIAPQRWQREVLPNAGRSVDYDELARIAAHHLLLRHPKAVAALGRINASDRNHAVDAAMIALVAGLRPQKCDQVGEAQAA